MAVGTTATGMAAMAAGTAQPAAAATPARPSAMSSTSCNLGNGIRHVVQVTFDNLHFSRDNPNVPSDLEMIPSLSNFITGHGTLLSNNHTPLIAHTAPDTLSTYSGLYGDRQGVGIGNSYNAYNADAAKTTDPFTAFTYWTDPMDDTARTPSASHDTNPNMVYSASVPATSTPPTKVAPAPWVPYTRAGCTVADFSTANMVLENANYDIAKVFGSSSPEQAQVAADTDPYKDNEVADYVGASVHCAPGDTFCSSAAAVKNGQSQPSPSASADLLPDEPGGYNGFQALHGARYIAPQLGAGNANLARSVNGHSYPVTNAKGNLVDLNGAEIDGGFTNPARPGFPGFSPTAAQSLAYTANFQEAGIPITMAYIADIHAKKAGQTGCGKSGALGPGDPCYVQNAKSYDAAFATFFQRLSDDGITAANTLFVFTADEGDHFAGANVGRAETPTPAGCDGVTVPCQYAPNTVGEVQADLPGLLSVEKNDTTPFSFDPQGTVVYVKGQPGANDPSVRTLEKDVAGLTAANPHSGNPNEKITNYLADPTEEQVLHFVNADPARTPTFTLFPKPDYYFTSGTNCTTPAACVTINSQYAWDHGYYAPAINTTWLGIAGPGVANHGVDGPAAAAGPNSSGPASGQGTIPGQNLAGTWADHTDVRPTMLALLGLKDDFIHDGRVLTEDLTSAGAPSGTQSPSYLPLATCYKQLNASVGRFGTDTLVADHAAITGSDPSYQSFQGQLSTLAAQRDTLATQIKADLDNAAFGPGLSPGAAAETQQCTALLASADALAAGSPNPVVPESPWSAALPAGVAVAIGGVALGLRRRAAARTAG